MEGVREVASTHVGEGGDAQQSAERTAERIYRGGDYGVPADGSDGSGHDGDGSDHRPRR